MYTSEFFFITGVCHIFRCQKTNKKKTSHCNWYKSQKDSQHQFIKNVEKRRHMF